MSNSWVRPNFLSIQEKHSNLSAWQHFSTCRTKLLFESEKKTMHSKFFKERTFGSFCLEKWWIVFFFFSNEVFLHETSCHLYQSIHLDRIHAPCVTYKHKNLRILGFYILTKWLGSNWINIAHDVNPTFDCMPHLFIQEAPLTHAHLNKYIIPRVYIWLMWKPNHIWLMRKPNRSYSNILWFCDYNSS